MAIFTALQVLTAAQVNALTIPQTVIKQATESVTSSTTLQDDDELKVTLAAGYSYLITARLICGGATGGDIAVAWKRTGTLNQTGSRMCTGPSINTTDVSGTAAAATTVGVLRRSGGHALTTGVNYGTDGTATTAVEETFILSAAVSGVLTLQWAQNASSGTATTVQSGSYLVAEVVGP